MLIASCNAVANTRSNFKIFTNHSVLQSPCLRPRHTTSKLRLSSHTLHALHVLLSDILNKQHLHLYLLQPQLQLLLNLLRLVLPLNHRLLLIVINPILNLLKTLLQRNNRIRKGHLLVKQPWTWILFTRIMHLLKTLLQPPDLPIDLRGHRIQRAALLGPLPEDLLKHVQDSLALLDGAAHVWGLEEALGGISSAHVGTRILACSHFKLTF